TSASWRAFIARSSRVTSSSLPAARASSSCSRTSSTSARNAASTLSPSTIPRPARASRYSPRGTGRLSGLYAWFNSIERRTAATRSAAGALAKRSGWTSAERAWNAASSCAASTSNRGSIPRAAKRSELNRLSTAARALRIGIVELEAVAHHPAHEVELHAREVDEALRVDDDRHAERREDLVGRLRLLGPLEDVREARAASAAQADADRGLGRAALGALARDLLGRGL